MKYLFIIVAFLFCSFSFGQSLSKHHYNPLNKNSNLDVKDRQILDYEHVIGDDSPDETWVITGDSVLTGDLLLLNQGKLILQEGSALSISGNLVSLNTSQILAQHADLIVAGHYYALGQSVMQVDFCNLSFPMDYRYQYGIFVMDTANVSIRDTDFDFADGQLEGSVIGSASLNFERDSFAQSVTISAMGESVLNVESCVNAWEFLLTDSCSASFAHNESLILWFYFPENVTANYAFPAGVWVEDMDFNQTIPGLEEIPYSVSIDSCTNVNWGMFPMAGSNVTITNSDMRTCGWIFNDGGEHTVTGMMNEQFYAMESFNPGDRQLNLVNSRVRTWNFYSMNASLLNIEGCFYGEALSMEDGTIQSFGGICDGSGGYFGANHGNINAFASQIECQVVMEGRSSGTFINSELYYPWAEHVFAGHSIAVFANTERNQGFSVRDTSFLVDLALDSLSMQSIGDFVPVRGNAQDFVGQDAPYFVNEYRLYYASADLPDDRNLIAEGISGAIYQDVIAHWNTHGLMPGDYILYLQAIINGAYDEPVEIAQDVNLYDFTGISTESNFDFSLYPNPATAAIYLFVPESNTNCTFSVFNVAGEQVMNKKFESHAQPIKIDIRNLAKGSYFLKTDDKVLSFVKE